LLQGCFMEVSWISRIVIADDNDLVFDSEAHFIPAPPSAVITAPAVIKFYLTRLTIQTINNKTAGKFPVSVQNNKSKIRERLKGVEQDKITQLNRFS